MKRFGKLLFALCGLLLLLAAVPASATNLYGPVFIYTSAGVFGTTSSMTVKFCTNSNGTGLCYQTTTAYNCYGGVCYSNWYQLSLPDGYNWYFFAWAASGNWGSDTSPSEGRFQGGGPTVTSIYLSGPVYAPFELHTFPSPLPPQAVYPTNGQQNVPVSFTLKWTSGSDGYRSSYPITYDIYSHGHGGSDLLVASNVACNPDASGNCTMAISNVLSSSYIYWRVVAKLNPGIFPSNPYYTTNSSQFTFTTVTNPNALVSFLTSDWTHYLTASGCGGGALAATSISQGGCESFKVIDLNGGNLISGETVNLQLGNLWYIVAANGGGSQVNVNSTSAGSWETFTVVKLSGAPGTRIFNGDWVAFRTSNGSSYVSAFNGGGSSVNASATSAGWAETFVYSVH